MLTNLYTRQAAYTQAAADLQELEEEEERRRARQRAGDTQAVQGAEEATRGILANAMRPAPVVQPAPHQDNSINWGKALGETIAKVGGAAISRLTQDKPEPPDVAPPPLPKIDLTMPRPPSESPTLIPSAPPEQASDQPVDDDTRRRLALRPAQTSDQLADVHEYTNRLAPAGVGVAAERPRRFAPAPVSDSTAVEGDADARRRRALVPLGASPAPLVSERPAPVFTPAPESDVTLPSFASGLRPYVRPEDVKPTRNLPLPGEEQANDERVRAMLEEAGGVVEGGDVHTRDRIARLRPYMEGRVAEIEANPTHQNGNSRLAGVLKMAARGALQGFSRTGSLAGAAGGAITGGVAGAVNKNLDERFDEQDAVARYRAALQGQYEREAAGLKLDDARSQIRYRDSMTDYNQTTRKDEAAARSDDKAKRQLLAQLGRMPSIDPAKHGAFLSEWQRRFGEPFDVEGYNNKKGNFTIRGIVTDPSKPQETHDLAVNFATGETRDLGLSGYTVPRDPSGMSESERRVDSDRDRGFNALERQRSISNELQRSGLNLSRERFDFSRLERDDRLSEGARKGDGRCREDAL